MDRSSILRASTNFLSRSICVKLQIERLFLLPISFDWSLSVDSMRRSSDKPDDAL